ncbi:MAG: PD40 domain-containing protein [Bdellovibrionales bacterium]|nr:PD40 domain-containing protein [Bdellovibrionales bacterium]
MKLKNLILFCVSATLSSCASIPSYLETAGLSPYTRYKTFDTEHFHFVYADGYLDFTEKAAGYFEQAHSILQPILKWTPRSKANVLIADNEDAANGFSLPAFRVGMVLVATPPETWFATSYTEDWIKLLVFHEYTHFLNLDPTTGWMEGLRLVFGDGIRPNGLLPLWMIEGLAVYMETRTTKLGRGRSPYWESILRAFVHEGKFDQDSPDALTLDRVNGKYPYFPGGEIPYLFGYHLLQQFAKDKVTSDDPEAGMGELSMRSSSRIPYFIEGNLENVMSRNWKDYWENFVRETELRMGEQIRSVIKTGETSHEAIAKSDFSALSAAWSPDGQWLAYTEDSLDDRTRLILLNLKTGEKRALDEKILGVGVAFTPDSKHLVFSALVREHSYSLYSDLFDYNIESDSTEQLTSGRRAKDPAISPDGKTIAWLSVDHGTPKIESAPLLMAGKHLALGDSRVVFNPGKFAILGGPKFFSDSEVIFSDQEYGAAESMIISANLLTGSSKILIKDGEMNRYPVALGERIFYVSNRTGIENIYEWNKGEIHRVTNVVSGAIFPFFSPTGVLCGNLMTSEGYQLVQFKTGENENLDEINLAKPDAPGTLPQALEPSSLKIDDSAISDYAPFSSLLPRSWSPFYAYQGALGSTFGAYALGFDTTGQHQYSVLGSYNADLGNFDGAMAYTLYTTRPVFDFYADTSTAVYDITNNPRDFYRRSTKAEITASYPLLWARSRLTPSLSIFNSWNRVYDTETGDKVARNDFQYSNPYVPGFGASLAFTNARTTRLGFMPELGEELILSARNLYNLDRYSILRYRFGWNHYFGLGNHFVLRSKAQWLGSSRSIDRTLLVEKQINNPFDRGDELSFSRIAFRGYSNSDLIPFDRNAGVAALDFHFPLSRFFFGLGDTTPAFFKQSHGFVFAESVLFPQFNGSTRVLPSLGLGLSIDTQVLLQLPLRFNLEYQEGLRKEFGGSSLIFLSIQSASLI